MEAHGIQRLCDQNLLTHFDPKSDLRSGPKSILIIGDFDCVQAKWCTNMLSALLLKDCCGMLGRVLNLSTHFKLEPGC